MFQPPNVHLAGYTWPLRGEPVCVPWRLGNIADIAMCEWCFDTSRCTWKKLTQTSRLKQTLACRHGGRLICIRRDCLKVDGKIMHNSVSTSTHVQPTVLDTYTGQSCICTQQCSNRNNTRIPWLTATCPRTPQIIPLTYPPVIAVFWFPPSTLSFCTRSVNPPNVKTLCLHLVSAVLADIHRVRARPHAPRLRPPTHMAPAALHAFACARTRLGPENHRVSARQRSGSYIHGRPYTIAASALCCLLGAFVEYLHIYQQDYCIV
jgi:hypothetical protein